MTIRPKITHRLKRILLATIVVLLALMTGRHSSAETRNVITVGNGCLASDAFENANFDQGGPGENSCARGGGADTIVLTHDISGNFNILTDITIEGNGHTINGSLDLSFFNFGSDSVGARLNLKNTRITNPNNRCLMVGPEGYPEIEAVAILNDSTVTGCKATGDGGGIHVRSGSRIVVRNSTIENNTSPGNGGGIYFANGTSTSSRLYDTTIRHNGVSGHGGGIFIGVNSPVSFETSLIHHNSAQSGGGIRAESSTRGNTKTYLTNSTVTHNTAFDGPGGGIFLVDGDLQLLYATVTNNRTTSFNSYSIGAGIAAVNGSVVTFERSIISGNFSFLQTAPPGHEIYTEQSSLQSFGGNVFGRGGFSHELSFVGFSSFQGTDFDASYDRGDILHEDILNPTLADNGGATHTHALVEGSPAIDRMPSGSPAYDQRGVLRPARNGFDSGAFELERVANVRLNGTACNLIEAIQAANANAPRGTCPAGGADDVIELYQDVTLEQTLEVVNSKLTIVGNGHTLSGNGQFRILRIGSSGELLVSNTLLRDGRGAGGGGAIYSDGTLTVNNSTFIDNQATSGSGGAITVPSGMATVKNSTFENNSAAANGGALDTNQGTLIVRDSTLSGNHAHGAGGGISSAGTVEVTDSTLHQNTATGAGGGINSFGNLKVSGTSLSTNSADLGGSLHATGTTRFERNWLGNNQARQGGGIYNTGNLTLINNTVGFNTASEGAGGLFNHGTLNLRYNTIAANSGGTYGGGIVNESASATIIGNVVAGNNANGWREVFTGNSITSRGNVYGTGGFSANQNFGDYGAGSADFDASSDRQNVPLGDILLTDSNGDLVVADNGGSTPSIMLSGRSPAIDRSAEAHPVDQRNFSRPFALLRPDTPYDAGAIERRGEVLLNGAVCNLAEAVISANGGASAACPYGMDGADTITLLADITLDAPTPWVTSEVTIDGNGKTLDGAGQHRLLGVENGGTLTVQRIVIQNGATTGRGGGIFNDGTLVVRESTLRNNQADNAGGAIGGGTHGGATIDIAASTFYGNSAQSNGGALDMTLGALKVVNSTLINNVTSNDGGALGSGGSVELRHVTIVANQAGGQAGGVLNYSGPLVIQNSLIAGNSAPNGREMAPYGAVVNEGGNLLGSGAANRAENFINFAPSVEDFDASSDQQNVALAQIVSTTLGDHGGATQTLALVAGSPAIDRAQSGSFADQRDYTRPMDNGYDSGAYEFNGVPFVPNVLFNGVTCDLPSAMTAANRDVPVGRCPAGTGDDTIQLLADITLVNALPTVSTAMMIDGNGFTIDGGGLLRPFTVATLNSDLTLENITVQNGLSAQGGAILVQADGMVTVRRSTLTGNRATDGGAIFAESGSVVEIHASTLVNNSAESPNRQAPQEQQPPSGRGGAIFARDNTVRIQSSTLVGNSADTHGGGLYLDSRLTLENSIVSGNRANELAHDVYSIGMTRRTLGNVIGSSAGVTAANFSGRYVPSSADFNASSDASNRALSQIVRVGQDDHPLLSGNRPQVVALVPSSPAIDWVMSADCTAAALNQHDQRNVERNHNGSGGIGDRECDAGAYEYDGEPTTIPTAVALTRTDVQAQQSGLWFNLSVLLLVTVVGALFSHFTKSEPP